MKSLVVYSSQTNNTKTLAKAVYDTLPDGKEICPIEEAPDSLADYDLVAVGFWLQAGKPDPKSEVFLSKIGSNNLFLFATHGAAKGSTHAQNAIDSARELAPAAHIVGTYSCPGEVNPKVLATAAAKPEPPAWLADSHDAIGHPDQTDIAELCQLITDIGN